jgi:hypothetical protein
MNACSARAKARRVLTMKDRWAVGLEDYEECVDEDYRGLEEKCCEEDDNCGGRETHDFKSGRVEGSTL